MYNGNVQVKLHWTINRIVEKYENSRDKKKKQQKRLK